jgi:hypothetical protein
MAKKQPSSKPAPKASKAAEDSASDDGDEKPTIGKASADEDDASSESSADEMVLVEGAGWDEDYSSEDEDDEEDAGGSSKKRKKAQGAKEGGDSSEPTDYDFTLEEMGASFEDAVFTMLKAEPFYAVRASALAEKVVEQVSVGTVITQPEAAEEVESSSSNKKSKKSKGEKSKDSTAAATTTDAAASSVNARYIYGLATLLNTTDTELADILPSLLKPLSTACPALNSLLKNKSATVGLLVSNILINLPHTLCQSLHNSLLSDVAWAQLNATGEGGAERELYKFTHVLVVSQFDASEGQGEITKDAKGRYANLPPLRKIIDEYMLKYSFFEPFVTSVKRAGGESSAKYLVGAVRFDDFKKAVKDFGAEI